MKTALTATAILTLCALTAPAEAKTPPPVTITVSTTCVVAGLMPSDYHATATITGTGPVDLHADSKGLLASNVALPAQVDYFGPVGVSTDDVYATTVDGTKQLGDVKVHTPCVKAAQGSA